MMNKLFGRVPHPIGQELDRISKESERFREGGVDSMSRIAKESERLRESDVDAATPDVLSGKKKPRAARESERLFGEKSLGEKNGQGG
jgi:hypothetical protein